MKKCCFIIPYFGKFPEYFSIFLKTCAARSQDYQWLIFTDDKREFDYPSNVNIIYTTFTEIVNKIQSKFEFKVVINEPHKLCDFKPAYGYIFEEYLKEYEFWGHCDLDTIIGDLDNLLTRDILDNYDKIFCLGHMILYRNTYDNNRVFMKPWKGRLLYKESFSSQKTTIFDETFRDDENIHSIFLSEKKRVFEDDWSVNFLIQPTKFIRTKYDAKIKGFVNENSKEEYLYVWDNGHIYRFYLKNNKLKREEFLYMHLQLRKMTYKQEILFMDKFKIIPEKFMPIEEWPITVDNLKKIKKYTFNHHFINMKIHNFKHKIKKIRENA